MRAWTDDSLSTAAAVERQAEWAAAGAGRAPWVALLGVDGSGKSSVLRRLAEHADELPYRGLRVFHRRPRVVYDTPRTPGAPIDHYGKPNHGPLKSMVKIAAMALDWQVGYWRSIRALTAQGYLVIADRHSLFDILADPQRYRYGGPAGVVRLALRMTPRPAMTLLLDAPAEILHARKPELSLAQITELRNKYLQLFHGQPGCAVIDATRPLDEVVSEVLPLLSGQRISSVRSLR